MIRWLRIQGFKSLCDVKLEMGQVNVLVGANGSGKTNLLEAIGLLCQRSIPTSPFGSRSMLTYGARQSLSKTLLSGRKGGKLKKPAPRYRAIPPDIVRQWENICRICSQAQAFSQNIQQYIL